MEEMLIKNYYTRYLYSNQKKLLYKLCTKLSKINNAFLSKVQVYFPKLYDLISFD